MKRRVAWSSSGWVLLSLIVGWLSALPGTAAMAPDDRAFTNALRRAQGKWWDLAEQEFANFVQVYSNSPHRTSAILLQAQARYKQGTNSAGAAALLSANMSQAGPLADAYEFWLGEAWSQGSNYLAAAGAYGRVVDEYTNSALRLQAAYNQAWAFSRLDDWTRVAALLGAPDTPLQAALRSDPSNPPAVDGALLLADAQLRLKRYRATEAALLPLAAVQLPAGSDWRRRYLLCQAQLGDDRPADALGGVAGLEAAAAASGQRELQAGTVELKAGILQRLGRTAEAIAEYEKNLAPGVPADRRRQALLALVELKIDQGQLDDASQRLEKFLSQNPQDKASAAISLALGEVNLYRWAASAPGGTAGSDLLQTALVQLSAVLTNDASHAFDGRAQLARGWCLWLRGATNESQAAFAAAARALPESEDQTVARFKWADAQFAQGDFRGALTNYSTVVRQAAARATPDQNLLEPALYQQLRAALVVGDEGAASNAMAELLQWYPESYVCQSGLLLLGQSVARTGRPAEARAIFSEFEQRFPHSTLLPDVRLALARTWSAEGKWTDALAVYDAWVTNFPASAELPQAEYYRGLAYYQAGRETNALVVFTDLVTRFPTNPFAAPAQFWVGEYDLRHGDYANAESAFQLLFQKWPSSSLVYLARLKAGEAAVRRQGFSDAAGYFTALINDTNCPPDLAARAWFAYGDATMESPPSGTNAPEAGFRSAIAIFGQMLKLYPTNELTLPAQGRIGDCYLQWAAQDPTQLTNAINTYQKLMDDPRAGVSDRSQAEVGLAVALDKQALRGPAADQAAGRRLALQHYLNVVYQSNLREGEPADPFWVKRAGLEAARVAEELQLWSQAAQLYDDLAKLLPALRPSLESKALKAREHLSTAEQ